MSPSRSPSSGGSVVLISSGSRKRSASSDGRRRRSDTKRKGNPKLEKVEPAPRNRTPQTTGLSSSDSSDDEKRDRRTPRNRTVKHLNRSRSPRSSPRDGRKRLKTAHPQPNLHSSNGPSDKDKTGKSSCTSSTSTTSSRGEHPTRKPKHTKTPTDPFPWTLYAPPKAAKRVTKRTDHYRPPVESLGTPDSNVTSWSGNSSDDSEFSDYSDYESGVSEERKTQAGHKRRVDTERKKKNKRNNNKKSAGGNARRNGDAGEPPLDLPYVYTIQDKTERFAYIKRVLFECMSGNTFAVMHLARKLMTIVDVESPKWLTRNDPGVMSITISGPPGSGKTALAKCVAAILSHKDAIIYIPTELFQTPTDATAYFSGAAAGTVTSDGEISVNHRVIALHARNPDATVCLVLEEIDKAGPKTLEVLMNVYNGMFVASTGHSCQTRPYKVVLISTSNYGQDYALTELRLDLQPGLLTKTKEANREAERYNASLGEGQEKRSIVTAPSSWTTRRNRDDHGSSANTLAKHDDKLLLSVDQGEAVARRLQQTFILCRPMDLRMGKRYMRRAIHRWAESGAIPSWVSVDSWFDTYFAQRVNPYEGPEEQSRLLGETIRQACDILKEKLHRFDDTQQSDKVVLCIDDAGCVSWSWAAEGESSSSSSSSARPARVAPATLSMVDESEIIYSKDGLLEDRKSVV